MKYFYRSIVAVAVLAGMFMFTACDWESGSQENFNTSGGSANVNISGFYRGRNGGRMVERTSNGNINSMTIQQSGNRVQVTDNQGSTYSGTIGAPLVSGNVDGGTVQAGATVASYQISFTGRDGVSARDINFTGVLTVIAVTDIVARSGSTDDDSNTTTTTTFVGPADTDPSDGTTSTTGTSTDTNSSESGTSFTYSLSGPNSQLQLQGTWVEIGGVTSSVNGFGPPAQGNIVVGP